MQRTITSAALAASLLVPFIAHADEGMWLYNDPPTTKLKEKYNFVPDDAWLQKARLSSARLAGGCSASFVSENGLVMTNHHCAHDCIQQLSTAEKDFIKSGFYAKTEADEVKCPEIEINELVEITNVTDRINKVTQGLSDQKFNEAQKGEMSKIEKECSSSDQVRCDVVTLYHGGAYHLYKYKRFQDVRLVFAPELSIAFFGGDPDNFNFPRYDLDVSFLRVYENGKPAHMDNYFKWSKGGAKEGELTFVSGHPGKTDRQLTVAQLMYQRDVALPDRLFRLAEMRGQLTQFQERSAEAKRVSTEDLFGVENSFKALRGMHLALLDPRLMDTKRAAETALRGKIAAKPELEKQYGAAFDAIEKAMVTAKDVRQRYQHYEGIGTFRGRLAWIAKTLVRAAEERAKPNEKRFRELTDAALPRVTQDLFSSAPVYDDLEKVHLTFALTKMREDLSPDDPVVRKIFGKDAPADIAARVVDGTKLKDIATRKALWDGGKKAIDASKDPLIVLLKQFDLDARALRKKYEDEVESKVKKNSELIARARFAVEGANSYPDATFTLRLSYGQVKGWMHNGKQVKPITDFAGAFERATGRPPFDLPESWTSQKAKLDMKTPFNFVTTNDIIGGNSGSPVFNKNAEVVGLVFDGNLPSLGGDYWFDETVNRTVAVHSEALLHALDRVYHADRIVTELRPAKVGMNSMLHEHE